jgi:UDP-N-acetylglucosamine 2-epimerase (non-hydrolysing)
LSGVELKIVHVIGARPNFMKAAPVYRALSLNGKLTQLVVHTGQHYHFNMSDIFFQQLEMPEPDINLQVGSATHARQTGDIMIRLEPVLLEHRPDYVVVYGDVNSTVAAALVCSKLGIACAHVEAGLRSFDRSMPEEINRLVTDQLADVLFTPSEDGDQNLRREGIPREKIHFVGNVMIDTLVRMLPASQKQVPADLPERFALVTLHRPSNVDDLPWLQSMLRALECLSDEMHVIFPVHPRTRDRLSEVGVNGNGRSALTLTEPMAYIPFLALQQRATVVITDSGGIQEETTYLGTPCLTVRENTERPITTTMGTNVLVGRDPERIYREAHSILIHGRKPHQIPPLWDGHAAERISEVLLR